MHRHDGSSRSIGSSEHPHTGVLDRAIGTAVLDRGLGVVPGTATLDRALGSDHRTAVLDRALAADPGTAVPGTAVLGRALAAVLDKALAVAPGTGVLRAVGGLDMPWGVAFHGVWLPIAAARRTVISKFRKLCGFR